MIIRIECSFRRKKMPKELLRRRRFKSSLIPIIFPAGGHGYLGFYILYIYVSGDYEHFNTMRLRLK